MKLRQYQLDLVQQARDAIRAGHKRIVIQMGTGGGKCLGKGTPVILYDGSVIPVEDVAVGDLLMGPDSTPRRVVSLARGQEMLYRVTPKKGDSYVVNESHILSLKMTPDGRHPGKNIVNLTVRDYLASSKSFKHKAKGWRVGVDFAPTDNSLPIPPYMFGLWLGDGHSTHYAITTGDIEVAESVCEYAHSLGKSIRCVSNSAGSVVLHVKRRSAGAGDKSMASVLRDLGVVNNKHIPHCYLTASREDRMQLLAGILDSDGYYSGKGYDVTFKSENLMDGLLFLARSLGFAVNKRFVRKVCTNNGKAGWYYNTSINGDLPSIPCRLARHNPAPRRQKKDHLVTGITVEPVGEGDYYGFELSGPDKLFLLGDFTVTHNTPTGCSIIEGAYQRGHEVWVVCHKNFLVEQMSEKLRRFGVQHGILASNTTYNPRQRVHVCSLGVLRNRHHRMRPPSVMLWDECHHLGARTWTEIMQAYPDTLHIGLTATPIRPGGGGLGDHFQHLIVGPSVADLIAWGKQHTGEGLCGYRYFSVQSSINTAGLHSRAGEFIAEEQAEILDKPAIIGDAVAEFRKHCPDRRFITFAVNVAHAAHVAESYRDAGIQCVNLDGTMDKRHIKRVLADLEAGVVQGVSSVNLFLEGLDVSSINCVQWLRATKSRVVKMQGDGRGLRNEPGKDHLVILDHVENWKRFGLPDDHVEWDLEPSHRQAAADPSQYRECKVCFSRFRNTLLVCPECNTTVDVAVRKIEERDGELVELTPEVARRAISPERRAQQKTRTRDGLIELFMQQKREKLGRDLTDAEKQAQVRRAGHVIQARMAKQRPTWSDWL